MHKLKDWRDVINEDFPKMEITQETVENVRMTQRGYRVSARVATGRVYTSAEYEAKRAKILATPLP